MTLYIMMGFAKHEALMKQLGKHKVAKSCLYIKNLSDIHLPTLKKLLSAAGGDFKALMRTSTATGRSRQRRNLSRRLRKAIDLAEELS